MERARASSEPSVDDGKGRRSPGIVRLYVGMTVAPLAWALHMLVSYSLAAHACFPTDAALGRPVWPDLRSFVVVATVGAWLMLWAGFLVAWLNWRATGRASSAGSGQILQTGSGRSRFMALCGLLVSGLFAVALCFTTAGVFVIPDCGP